MAAYFLSPMKKKTGILLLLLLSFTIAFSQQLAKPIAKPGNRMRGMNKKQVIMPALVVNFNLLNAALYGPIIQLEAKLKGKSFLVPFLRYSYAGVVSQYEWTNFEDDSEYDPSSIAGGLGFKHFLTLSSRKAFAYYGVFGEYIHEKGLHDTYDARYEYEQIRNAAALYGNLGYRWNMRRGFHVDLGIMPGVAFDIKNEGTYTQSGGPKDDFSEISFTGMVELSFGWRLKRGF
jgi:hypothetical protein